MYAAIMVAAEVVETSLDIHMDKESIAALLMEQHTQNQLAMSTPEFIFEEIKRKILENIRHFIMDIGQGNRFMTYNCEVYGMKTFLKRAGTDVFLVKKDILQNWVADISGFSVEALQKAWVAKGWLVDFSCNHYTMKKTLCGVPTECYALRVGDGDEDGEGSKIGNPPKTKKILVKSKVRERLLCDDGDDSTIAQVAIDDDNSTGEAENPN
jgi:hypothetical protein